MRNKNICFESSEIRLHGTLTLPDIGENYAACLFIGGSFPQTREGDVDNSKVDWYPNPLPERKLFFDEAHVLEQIGMATLRYDKRGCGQSEGDFNPSGLFDVIEDANNAIKWLCNQKEIDATRVGIAGQSEGAVIAMQLAAKNPDIAFCVWQGGIYNNLEDILMWQAESFWKLGNETIQGMKQNVPLIYWLYKQAEELRSSIHRGDSTFLLGDENWNFHFSLKNFKEHFNHPPSTIIDQIKCPVLLLHGELDHNTPPSEAKQAYEALLNAGNNQTTLEILPGLDHSFRRLGDPDEDFVSAMKRPLDSLMKDTLTHWLKRIVY